MEGDCQRWGKLEDAIQEKAKKKVSGVGKLKMTEKGRRKCSKLTKPRGG